MIFKIVDAICLFPKCRSKQLALMALIYSVSRFTTLLFMLGTDKITLLQPLKKKH